MGKYQSDFIAEIVQGLSETVGFRYNIEPQLLSYEYLSRERAFSCAKAIANSMGLPVSVKIDFVTKADERPATVLIPANLPQFGSVDMVNFPIDVTVYASGSKNNDSFVAVMAHEMAHIVLHSMRHPDKSSEIHTDLCAMLLGYQEAINNGRTLVDKSTTFVLGGTSTTTSTTTYGYLNDFQFKTAYKKISEIHKNYRFYCSGSLKCINDISKMLERYISDNNSLKHLIDDVAKNERYVKPDDVRKIGYFCSSEYASTVASNVSAAKSDLARLKADYEKLKHEEHLYMKHAVSMLDKTKSIKKLFEEKCDAMTTNFAVVSVYLPLLARLKLRFKMGHNRVKIPDPIRNTSTSLGRTPVAKVRNHYDNLKVTRNAPQEVVTAAYNALVKQYHPDTNDSEEARRIYKIITRAYEVLSDVKLRKEHDQWILEEEAETGQGSHTQDGGKQEGKQEKIKRYEHSEYISPSGERVSRESVKASTVDNTSSDKKKLKIIAIIMVLLIGCIIIYAVSSTRATYESAKKNVIVETPTPTISTAPVQQKTRPVQSSAPTPSKFKEKVPFEHPKLPLPETGKIYISTDDEGLSPLSVSVPSHGKHYYVKVVNKQSNECVRSFFIRSGSKAKIHVPLGVCYIKYACGSTWYGTKTKYPFGPDTLVYQADKEFNFSREDGGYTGFRIELIPQANGNLREKSISLDNF